MTFRPSVDLAAVRRRVAGGVHDGDDALALADEVELLREEVAFYRESMGGGLVDLTRRCLAARDELTAVRDQLVIAYLLLLWTAVRGQSDR